MADDFFVLKDGVPVAALRPDGTFAPLPGLSHELARRLTATLLSGLPEGERLECLLRRLTDEPNAPVPVVRVLSGLADLPGGLEIVRRVGRNMSQQRYVPPPKLSTLVSKSGAYRELRLEVKLGREWYDAGGRIRKLQPNPSFCGVQDKFTAVAELQESGLVLRAAGENERGNVLIKPHRSDIPFMAETEFVCMQTAKLCGLSAADCFLFESPVQGRRDIRVMDLAVLRFDRRDDGEALETADLAALMGLSPDEKYSVDRMDMLNRAGYFLPPAELTRLTEALFFGTLVGNGDMHLKNFSVMRTPGDDTWRLAPLYDMLSTEALRYEARLGLPVNKNAYAALTQEEVTCGYASVERLLDIAAHVEAIFSPLSDAVLAASGRAGYFTIRSHAGRMSAAVRRHVAEARAELGTSRRHVGQEPDEDAYCEEPTL